MADKIYIVTSGMYSSYRIEGVFSTEDEARDWISANSGPDNNKEPQPEDFTIEPYELGSVVHSGQ
jgi:hypothetical protein